MLIAGLVLSSILSLVIPVLIIVWIVRLIVNRHDKNKPGVGFREALLFPLTLAAGFVGLCGLYALPFTVLEATTYSNEVMVFHLIIGVGLLLAGLALKEFTGKFLMVLGILMLVATVIPTLDSLGSGSALIAILIAFAVLVVVTIRVSRKAAKNG